MTKITKRGGHVLEDDYPTHYLPNVGRQVMADGGEATLTAYEPTIGEKIYGAIAGLGSEKPSPERRRFAEGIRDIAGFVPGLGNVMSAQEAQRAGEGGRYGEASLAALGALPMIGGAERKAAEAAVDIAKKVSGYSPSEIGKYGAIRGYHLSPHEFEKFNPGVGVGTGAQTEGVGTYISSNPEGAKMWESAMPEGEKHLYEVHAPVDESTFINRNVPLNRQSLHVKDALEQFNIPSTVPKWTGQQSIDVPATGFDAYQHLRNQYGPEKASQMLSEAGISGMRFPGAGEGYNYVVYNPSILNIVGKERAYADGGATRFAAMDPSMLIGTSSQPFRGGEAYTDAGGQKIAAPFVSGMSGGYPVYDFDNAGKATANELPGGKNPFEDLLQFSWLSKLMGYADGGGVEGNVEFASPEVEQALKTAQEVASKPRSFEEEKKYEPFSVLPLKETKEGVEFDPYAGLLGSITRPAKYFYETMTGQKPMEPTSEEAIRAATDIAGTLTMGSGAFERPAGALAAGASRPGMGHNMPPEAIVPERVTNPLGMHSEAAEVARNLPQQRGTIEQMLGMMKQKVNPEELHWSGVAEAFQPGQKVTAEELASHFESKLPQVQETMYGGDEGNIFNPNRPLTPEFEAHYDDIVNNYADDYAEDMFGKRYQDLSDRQAAQVDDAVRQEAINTAREGGINIHSSTDEESGILNYRAPRYPTYVTPGGTNYREIVLHHPPSWKPEIVEKYGRFGFTGPDGRYRDYYTRSDAEQSARSMARHDVDGFTESHYDEPNVVGHIRMSDMEGPGGEKILNVHEFQSDWGQQARKKGVVTGKEAEDKAALVEKQRGMQSVITDFVKDVKQKASGAYKSVGMDDVTVEQLVDRSSPASLAQFVGGDELMNKYMRLIEENANLYEDIKNIDSRKPAAPYVTSREGQHNTPGWTDLLIKRVLQEAERGGYDKVVWDTPAEQAQRYMNQPQIVKGMQGYYGDLLPRRHKKVAPEIKIGEHEVGKPGSPIKGEEVADWLAKYVGPSSDYNKYKSAVERMPDAGPEQWLKASGLYDDYVIIKATEMGHEDPLNGLEVTNFGGKWNLYDRDVAKGVFDSKKEAYAAKKTLAGEKATQLLNQSTVKRPGFEMTPELKERIRRGLSAYRYGGEVEDALDVARSLK